MIKDPSILSPLSLRHSHPPSFLHLSGIQLAHNLSDDGRGRRWFAGYLQYDDHNEDEVTPSARRRLLGTSVIFPSFDILCSVLIPNATH
jgi:hypothetical protein